MSGGPGDGWVEMQIKGLILDPTSDVPVVILRQEGGALFLPIWIGVFEANAIALGVEGVQTPRPMTHDLLRSVLDSLATRLERVEIHALIEGTFHARLRLRGPGGAGGGELPVVEVDARPSDAIALALRTGASIWIAQEVLDGAVSTRQASELSSDEDDDRLRQWLENARPEDLGKYRM